VFREMNFKQRSLAFLITVLLAVLFSSSVYALENVSVKFTAETDSILLNETAKFYVTIENKGPNIQYLSIYSPEPQWSISTEPTGDILFKAYPMTEGKTTVMIKPAQTIVPGTYGVPVNMKESKTGALITNTVLVEVNPAEGIKASYKPAIKFEIDIPKKVDPREEFIVLINLQNQNQIEYDKINVHVESELFSKDHTTLLGSRFTEEGKKRLKFKVPLDKYTTPQQVTIYASLSLEYNDEDYSFDAEPAGFSILPIGEMDKKEDVSSFLFKKRSVIKFSNEANERQISTYQAKVSGIAKLFTSASPKPEVTKKEDGTYMKWTVTLEPSEKATITITKSYRPILYLIILIIIVLVCYYKFRSPLVLTKTPHISARKDKGVFELGVKINVSNRSAKPVEDISIKDKLPHLIDIHKEYEVGTLQPSKILKHESKGTIIRYTIERLDPGEERIISYKARAKLSIVGHLTLPSAIVRYKGENNKFKSLKSKKVGMK